MNFNNFLHQNKKTNSVKFHQYKKGIRHSLDYNIFFEKIKKVNSFFKSLLDKKKPLVVITIIENSIEWNVFDLGLSVLSPDILYLPISPTIQSEQLENIFKKLNPDYIVVSELASNLKRTRAINEKKILLVNDVINYPFKSVEAYKNINEKFYFLTSGTTGEFKIFEHYQDFVYDNIIETYRFYNFSSKHRVLSILPIHYAFERMYNYVFQLSGSEIFYADITKSLVENFIVVRPNYACIVPALLEELLIESEQLLSFLSYIREVKPMLICSGAGISKNLREKLNKLNLKIYEMYGSTETLIVAANNHAQFKKSTSGKIFNPDRVQINKKKQLLVKTSYVKHIDFKENKTNIIENDWHKTGDIAEVEEGFLKIIGRDSIFFKNAFGLFINPNTIEKEIKNLDIIKEVIVFGQNQKNLSCIIELRNITKENEKKVISFLSNYNKNKEDALKVKQYFISKNWTHKTGEKTLSHKIKRTFIIEKYGNKLKAVI